MYYGPVGETAFLVSMTVSDILDLMVMYGIRWVGECHPAYKIVPDERSSRFFVRSLEGDKESFRRELEAIGLTVAGFDRTTQEYCVHGTESMYEPVATLWWTGMVASVPGRPFFHYERAGRQRYYAEVLPRPIRHP